MRKVKKRTQSDFLNIVFVAFVLKKEEKTRNLSGGGRSEGDIHFRR